MSSGVPRRTVVAVVLATTAAQAASTMGTAVFPVIAPRLAADMGLAPATIGYLISLAFGAAAIASPFMSFAVPRWGACRATQVGLVVCAIAMAFAASASLVGLGLCALLLGLGMTVMTPASGHLLFRFSPAKNRNLIFSIKQTGVPLGWMLMALVAPTVTLAFGWRWAVLLVLVLCLITAAALQRVRAQWDGDRKPSAARGGAAAAGIALLWRYPVLRWLSIASMFLSFVHLCVATFLVTMLVEEGGYSLVAAGLIRAAQEHPRINSTWLDTNEGADVVLHREVHLGIAADTPRGLLVPTIKSASSLGFVELARRVQALIDTARAGRSTPADLTGGTITLTNVGVFGVDGGTPIINPGQTSIMAMGRVIDRPWVVDGQILVRPVMQLSFSFDHRVIDGGIGSRALRSVATFLQDPAMAVMMEKGLT